MAQYLTVPSKTSPAFCKGRIQGYIWSDGFELNSTTWRYKASGSTAAIRQAKADELIRCARLLGWNDVVRVSGSNTCDVPKARIGQTEDDLIEPLRVAQSGGGGGTGGRDPYQWPFSKTSCWNMPIGSGAVYSGPFVNNSYVTRDNWAIDPESMVLDPDAPLLNLWKYLKSKYWSNPLNDPAPVNLGYGVRTPTNYFNKLADASWDQNTPNASGGALLSDNKTIREWNYGFRMVDDKWHIGAPRGTLDLYGDGVETARGKAAWGGHGGSMLSGVGGSIRIGELFGSDPIRHAVKLTACMKLFGKNTGGSNPQNVKTWPAFTVDASLYYGMDSDYPGVVAPIVPMGALLAIPYGTDVNSLGLETAPALKLAYALQRFGCYVVDECGSAGWVQNLWCMEWGVVEEGIQHGINFGGRQAKAKTGVSYDDWWRDSDRLLRACRVVTSNGPDSIGGGGTPLYTMAPDFGDPGGGGSPTGTPMDQVQGFFCSMLEGEGTRGGMIYDATKGIVDGWDLHNIQVHDISKNRLGASTTYIDKSNVGGASETWATKIQSSDFVVMQQIQNYVDWTRVPGGYAPPIDPPDPPPDPGGVNTLKPPLIGLTDRNSLPAAGVRPYVSAVSVKVKWSDLQPTQGGAVSLAPYQAEIDAITAANKKVRLRIDGAQQAPSWAKSVGGSAFPLKIVDPAASAAAGSEVSYTVGKWWDSAYLALYQDFITKLAAIVDTDPDFVEVTVSNASLIGGSEPFARYPDTTSWPTTGNRERLLAAGWTAEADIAAIKSGIDLHAAVFDYTRQWFTINPYEGFDIAGDRFTDWSKPVAVYANTKLGQRLTLGTTGIRSNGTDLSTLSSIKQAIAAWMATQALAGVRVTVQTDSQAGIEAAGGTIEGTLRYATKNMYALALEPPSGYEALSTTTLQDINTLAAANLNPTQPPPPPPDPDPDPDPPGSTVDIFFNNARYLLGTAQLNLPTADIRTLLITGSTLPQAALDPALDTVADLLAVATEAVGSGYSRKAITGKSFVKDDANNKVSFDCDNLTWASLNVGQVQAIAFYIEGANDAARQLLSLHTSGFPKTTDGTNFVVNIAELLRML